jgi:hypothetical protein
MNPINTSNLENWGDPELQLQNLVHSCEQKNVFRRKLASWNLEFCNSCVILLKNVQVPRRNSDSHLVFRGPTQLRAKKLI